MSVLQKIAKYNRTPLSIIEKLFFQVYLDAPPRLAPIFIIGAPRTGSTILYQLLTGNLDILYINNLICKFHRNPIFGFWLSHLLFKNRTHHNYRSDFGNTEKYGLSSPSECGNYWYRWIPRGQHFVDFPDVTKQMAHVIKTEINTISTYYHKPIIFKNLNLGQRLRLIHKAFPDARVVFIRRNPVNTAKSIMIARRVNKVRKNEWWSVKPPNYKTLAGLPEHKLVIAQIYYCEQQIKQDLPMFNNTNKMTIHYEDLLDHPAEEIDSIANCFHLKKIDSNVLDLNKPKRKNGLSRTMIELLEKEAQKYDWD